MGHVYVHAGWGAHRLETWAIPARRPISYGVKVLHPHTPIEERVAEGFFPCTQPSDEEYTDSEEEAQFDPAMDAKSTNYEVSSEGGQAFDGKTDKLPAFLMHMRLKELLDSDLRD
ncbi:hypothetical protein K470DRAFT_139340 [Piedraia hortae CBS 480.64]|uniref:Uncharacterized protein n=1 Tax=Piedraia hortae CBS 480.64 TaxID=1314780 RepID=A0A6A7C8Y1_9PEZI|nr:hypothetical protein K470DRAFT_139340 [Piedraia hortae CBS 480.64]